MVFASLPPPPPPARTLALHAANPRYLSFRGKPVLLVTSGEHYGAVLNLDFDYVRYLDALKADGMNLTRTFSGSYREVAGSFGIEGNTLAPQPDRYAAPWPRSATPGAADGQPRFDLSRWNEAHFARLRDFVRQADRRGIVVEFVLFCPFYEEGLWAVNPMNAANNVNGIGSVPPTEVYTLKHADLVRVHTELTRKLVTELNGFENVYFEICNEPYFGGITLEWQRRIGEVIVETEAGLPRKHLIAQNIANGSERVDDPFPMVSVFNYHYANPPDAVPQNRHLNRPIAFDETGFKGTADGVYRMDAWEFILAGGAVYSNLDYSFTAAHPDGTAVVRDPTPGGGGPALRRQLRILREFVTRLPFTDMAPDGAVVTAGVPAGATARVLAQPGRAYAVYLRGGSQATLTLRLPDGRYLAEWVDTKTGEVVGRETVRVQAGSASVASPSYVDDIALRLRRA